MRATQQRRLPPARPATGNSHGTISAYRATLAASLAIALLASSAAHAQLGRLFNSAEERQVLEALRQRAAGGAGAAPGDGGMAGAMAGMTAAGASTELPAGFPPQVPPPAPPPDARPDLGRDPAFEAGPAAGSATVSAMTGPGVRASMNDPGGPAATAPAAEQLTLNGVLRTSSGRNTVWLNNTPQRGNATQWDQRHGRKALTVTLPSGRRIVLQPGQRYDLGDGRVKDVNEP